MPGGKRTEKALAARQEQRLRAREEEDRRMDREAAETLARWDRRTEKWER